MSVINGSTNGVLRQQVQSEPEVISIPSDVLSELESMPTEELEGEEMKVMQIQPTVSNSEPEHPVYRAESPPSPTPPSPSSVTTFVEAPASTALMVCSHCFAYVMVSTANPKCLRCGLYDLFDVLRRRPERA